jgi:pilus assembly protein CpaE
MAEKQKRKNVGKIFCVTSAKGGVGVTSLSINLATSLAAVPGSNVALIDLNYPMGDVAPQLNLRSRYTVTDALSAAPRLDSLLLENYMIHSHGVAVLPGPNEFKPSEIPGADALARMLEVIAQTYGCAIVDLASSLDKEHLQVITQMATGVVVVVVPELPALWRTERMLRYLTACGVSDKLRLVINRSRKKYDLPDNEIERVLRHSLYWKLPNNYEGVIQAINSGNPVVTANHSELARSYRELAHNLTETPLPEKSRGLLKLFSS